MTHLGMGVMINMLFGGDRGGDKFRAGIGKTITALALTEDNKLHFEFADGHSFNIADEGQSCCETRYMTTDDDLPYYVGAELVDAEVADGPSVTGEYGDEHEQQFLKVMTSKGVFTVVTHNEHNGYYGGFWIVVQ